MKVKLNRKSIFHTAIPIKYLAIGVFTIIFFYCVTNVILVFNKVQKYPFVKSPNEFLRNFEESGSRITLELRCDWDQIICFDSHVVSPLYPHLPLKFYARTKKSMGNITKNYTIRKDRFWKVFWIQDDGTNSYFGPYRSDFTDKMETINLP